MDKEFLELFRQLTDEQKLAFLEYLRRLHDEEQSDKA
mgnify:FL=1